jgi:uncharacterized protein YuzE
MPITAEYDPEADALYVRISARERQRAVEINDRTYADVDVSGHVVGIEILYPGLGFDIEALGRRFSLSASEVAEIMLAIAATGVSVTLLMNAAISTRYPS